MRPLDILVACEMSGRVRDELIQLGHNAISCDLKDSLKPGPHIKGDVREALKSRKWDALIAFPDCTYLTISAEWAYGDGPYHQRVKTGTLVGAARREARERALEFVDLLMSQPIEKIAIENPVGAISSRIRQPDQIIQPWAFGDDASKATCLWLKNLPLLEPTFCVAPRLGAGGRPVWGNQTETGQNRLSPSAKRAETRSLTYPGIARAIARQWFGPESEFRLVA